MPRSAGRSACTIRMSSCTRIVLRCVACFEVPHLLKHATQRRTIRVHDDILMVLETKRLECPLHPIGMAAARSYLLDAQLSFPNRREHTVATRLAFTVFPRRGQPTHA